MAPAVAAIGLPVIAIQCFPWSTGFSVRSGYIAFAPIIIIKVNKRTYLPLFDKTFVGITFTSLEHPSLPTDVLLSRIAAA
jgi:hypothetical protein